MFDQIHTIAPLTMAALMACASLCFAGAALCYHVADKRGETMRRRAAGRMVSHGRAMRESYGGSEAAGMVADTLGDSFEYVEARTLEAGEAIYWAHVRVETASGAMVSHRFPVRAGDAGEARGWAQWALYESGAGERSHVTMIRDGKRIVA